MIIYTEHGTQVGFRFSARCRKCGVTQHPSYFYKDDKRMLDLQYFQAHELVLSTEDTGFSKKMLATFDWELTMSCMSFRAKCGIYNASNGYTKSNKGYTPQKKKVRVLFDEERISNVKGNILLRIF